MARGLRQSELARRAGMLPAQLCKIELGRNGVTGSTLARLASALDVPVGALLGEVAPAEAAEGSEAPDDQQAVRNSRYMSVIKGAGHMRAVREKVAAWDREICAAEDRLGMHLESSVQLVYPYGRDERAAEAVAREVRGSLGLGRQTVIGLKAALESAGVRIVPVSAPKTFQSAAFYNPVRRTLLIALNSSNTAERDAYRLAYELGAAVLFASSGFRAVADEGAAHRFLRSFSAAFLMPEESVRAEVANLGIRPDGWFMDALLFVKERFGVSAESFAMRLESLGLITPSLRQALRDRLHEYYTLNPDDMEPPPEKGISRLEILKVASGGDGGGAASDDVSGKIKREVK